MESTLYPTDLYNRRRDTKEGEKIQKREERGERREERGERREERGERREERGERREERGERRGEGGYEMLMTSAIYRAASRRRTAW